MVRRCLLVLLVACREPDVPSDGNLVGPTPDSPILPSGNLLLTGTVVTPDTVVDGAVLVEGDTITCVDTVAACMALPGAIGATVIDTHGVIAPGLIDTHNHILFDVFDGTDWLPSKVYQDHDQWTAEARYIAMLDVKQCLANDSQGKPTWCPNTPYGTATGSLRCEMDKWGELKGLISGTTSIVGLPGTSAACFGSIARSIDVSQNELSTDTVQTSALFPPSNPDGVCANFAAGKTTAFLAHVGEGIDAKAQGEFAKLGSMTTTPNCLYAPQTAITHGVAFTAADFATMAQHQMKLIWSPQSNVTLYNATADIPSALDAGVTIAIAPDWSMGGSVNLLDEMRFADAYDDAHFANRLAAKDLVQMATTHAATALALDSRLGSLAPGMLADLAVYAGDTSQPYDTILAAKPAQVSLVMVGGARLYGDPELAPLNCETIDVCGASKFACVAKGQHTDKLDQTFAQIQTALSQAMMDADAQTPTDGFDFAPLAPLASCN
jgi:5-methylthioadenosine/S-adenosylhomocysteine deaminase